MRKLLVASAFATLVAVLPNGQARAAPVAEPPPAVQPSTCSRTAFVWWSELLAPETDRLTEFYSKVTGWTTKIVDAEDQSEPPRSPEDKYTIFTDGQREIAGLMRSSHPESVHTATGWFTYIQVPDVAAAAAKAVQAGGRMLREPTETSEGHVIAVIADPMGNAFGLVTPANDSRC